MPFQLLNIKLACLTLLWVAAFERTLPAANEKVSVAAAMLELDQLLESRREIVTIRVTGSVENIGAEAYDFDSRTNGRQHRNDREYKRFPQSTAQENSSDKAIVDGEKLKRLRSRFGAELNTSSTPFNTQINAKVIGLLPTPLVALRTNVKLEASLVGQILSKSKSEDARILPTQIFNNDCISLEVDRDDLVVMRAYFDDSCTYRGCGIESGEYLDQLWIEEGQIIDGIFFPKKYRLVKTKGKTTVVDQHVTLTSVVVNVAFAPGEFDFVGLGVKDGDVVDVKDGSLDGSADADGIFTNGKIIPMPAQVGDKLILGEQSAMGQRRRLIGFILLVAAAICAFFLLFRRRTVP